MGALCTKTDDTIVQNVPKISEETLHNWQIWSQLDLLDEHHHLEVAAFMHKCLDLISTNTDSPKETIAVDGIHLHDVIHLEFPLKLDQIELMSEAFEKEADGMHIPLPANTMYHLLDDCKEFYKKKNNVIHLVIPSNTKLTIVGDLHGQLHDLLHIFKHNGPPSDKNWYLFNGNFVDQGNCSVEICALLIAYHGLYPNAIHFNRGTHEDNHLNRLYNFQKEVVDKYNRKMVAAFHQFFIQLPLAHIINNQVFVGGGGVPPTPVSIDQIQEIPRMKYQLHLPSNLSVQVKDQLTLMKMIVRSRSPVREGFEWYFDQNNNPCAGNIKSMPIPTFTPSNIPSNILVTIYSVSNFNHSDNHGSYMTINSSLEYTIQSFHVPQQFRINQSHPAFRSIEDQNRHSLVQLIGSNKKSLIAAFKEKDNQDTGLVTIKEWALILKQVLHLDLNWEKLITILLPPACIDKDKILYLTWLETYQIVYQNETLDIDTFYQYRKELQAIFCFFDKDHSGYITLDEFQQGCMLLNQHLPPESTHLHNFTSLFQELDLRHRKNQYQCFSRSFSYHQRLPASTKHCINS
ncbi:hypothetical protein THRCLA_03592 [Thraustotheca clavata]|uniref:EF-hand domain-containing protein n=1 Tax=Thraustotheca clavata TaxID=74557 RepID=A0A1W0A1K7_9STRA|nr:hypothetical protein THRCLA_03592 [Thraustotheca clavata]